MSSPASTLAAAQGVDHRGGAVERHDLHIDAGCRLEQFGGQVLRGADVGRADGELSGIGLRIGDPFAQCPETSALGADDHEVERSPAARPG
jgi:hypothetical protein